MTLLTLCLNLFVTVYCALALFYSQPPSSYGYLAVGLVAVASAVWHWWQYTQHGDNAD